VATTYEVRLTLADEGSATRPLADVLTRTLADTSVGQVTPDYSSAVDGGRLRVRVLVDAADASEAKTIASDALVKAVTDAGLSESAVTVADAEVRTSS
jgi:hypothetical protein